MKHHDNRLPYQALLLPVAINMSPDYAHLTISSIATAFGFDVFLMTNHVLGFSLIDIILCIFSVHVQRQIQTTCLAHIH